MHQQVGTLIKKRFTPKKKFLASLLINEYCSEVDCNCEKTFIVPFVLLAMAHLLQVVNK